MAITQVLSWSYTDPTQFCFEEQRGWVHEQHDYGAGLVIPKGGPAWKINGGVRSFYAYHSLPGLVPMYYLVDEPTIHVSQSLFAMRQLVQQLDKKIKDIQQCKEGVAYHWSSKGLRRYVVDTWKYEQRASLPLAKAAEQLLDLLVNAATFWRGKRVLTLVSGGTDGILTAYALKLAGVDQLCVCVGRTAEDFDPAYAQRYCQELGLPYELWQLPADDQGLQDLLTTALQRIEMADFSNVLMGMCNTMIADRARNMGFDAVANADLADVVLGNDLLTYSMFKKKHERPVPKQWTDYRLAEQLRTLPTNLQIFKAFEFGGMPVFQLFADREVIQHMLGLGFDSTPTDGTKPLYYQILNKVLSDPSWGSTGKKVGYYTGSGIGTIRLENPVLKDENIRRTFESLRP